MRQVSPIVRTKMPFVGNVWVTTTYASTSEVLRSKEIFVTNPRNAGRRGMAGFRWWMPSTLRAITSNMLGKDEPDHRRLRKIVETAFLGQSIQSMQTKISHLATTQLNTLERQDIESNGQVDLIKYFSRPFPLAVICELLGLPEQDRHKILRWGVRFTNIKNSVDLFRAFPAIWKISHYFREQFEHSKNQTSEGMISDLVSAEQHGNQLTEEELLATAFLLLLAGHETTVHLITAGILTLLTHPTQKEQLVQDWSRSGTAIDELLRYNSTVQTTEPRYVATDMEFHGIHLRRGDTVMPFLAAANADPMQFEHPETFDINRSPNQHLAFGSGIHTCLGLRLAKAEASTALQQIFTRFPEIELAVPATEVAWGKGVGTRSILSLPIRIRPAR